MPKVKKIVQPPDVQQSLGGHQQAGSFLGIEAVELPRAVVMKLAKSTGPPSMKLAKEVPVALTKASTVFINYLVAIAHDIATERSEKSLNVRHILEACKELDWSDGDELQKTLRVELEAFRKLNAAKKVQKASRPELNNDALPSRSASQTDVVPQPDEHAAEAQNDIQTEEEEDDDNDDEDEDDEMQVDELSANPGKTTTEGTAEEGDEDEEEEEEEADG